ncbi:MAG TPA: carbon-nitrogen hydrolase family protein [Dongiaceae bacterium]|nr:carbon-nitrogen hydrolase family protein [Dongiaceae bacterium]
MNGVLRAAIFQYQCRDESPAERLQRLDRMLDAHSGKLDLVICPELFLSGYNVGDKIREHAEPQGGPFAQAAAELAKRHGTALTYGYPERAGGVLYNAAACIDRAGRTIAHHRKLRLPNAFEKSHFVAGDAYTLFQLHGWSIALLVCYDVEFPEAVRACAARGAQLVVAPTALKTEWAFVARSMIPTRAFENRLFVAYANYCGTEGSFEYLGESCFAAPTGGVIAGGSTEALVTAALDPADISGARKALTYLDDFRGLDEAR